MESGLHQLKDSEYHSLPFLSASQLKDLLRSPLHSKVKKQTTPAMQFGTYAHMCILEFDLFKRNHIPVPKIDKRTVHGKELLVAIEKQRLDKGPDAFLINVEDLERLTRMREMIANGIGPFVNSKPELAAIWDLPKDMAEMYNLPPTKCKAKIDLLVKTDTGLKIIEYKTTQDASKQSFAKTIANMKYHLSAAWYIWGLSQVTGTPMGNIEYEWLAQETEEPFDYAIYKANDEMLQRGWERVAQGLEKYALGVESNFKIGYPKEPQEINLPLWELSNFE